MSDEISGIFLFFAIVLHIITTDCTKEMVTQCAAHVKIGFLVKPGHFSKQSQHYGENKKLEGAGSCAGTTRPKVFGANYCQNVTN